MKVKEVINKCEELLEVYCTREDLLDCFNLTEYDMALNYLPLYETHQCNSKTVNYTEFKYNPVQIVLCNCIFKIYPNYIESEEDITYIQYAYTPDKKELYDDCSYDKEFFDCLVYGTISEFLLSQGFYEEAALWGEKYKREIKLLMI